MLIVLIVLVSFPQKPLREVSLVRLLLLVVLLLNVVAILLGDSLLLGTVKCLDLLRAQELRDLSDREAGVTVLNGHAAELVLGLSDLAFGIGCAALGAKQLDTTRQTRVTEVKGTVTYMGLVSIAMNEVVHGVFIKAALTLEDPSASYSLLQTQ